MLEVMAMIIGVFTDGWQQHDWIPLGMILIFAGIKLGFFKIIYNYLKGG